MIKRLKVGNAEVEQAVANCPKQRFQLKRDSEVLYIRASQGHSIKTVVASELLERITDPSKYPDVCSCVLSLVYLSFLGCSWYVREVFRND